MNVTERNQVPAEDYYGPDMEEDGDRMHSDNEECKEENVINDLQDRVPFVHTVLTQQKRHINDVGCSSEERFLAALSEEGKEDEPLVFAEDVDGHTG